MELLGRTPSLTRERGIDDKRELKGERETGENLRQTRKSGWREREMKERERNKRKRRTQEAWGKFSS